MVSSYESLTRLNEAKRKMFFFINVMSLSKHYLTAAIYCMNDPERDDVFDEGKQSRLKMYSWLWIIYNVVSQV